MVLYRRPESVLVLIYTQKSEVLVLQRSQPFSFWQSVTGSLHYNESKQSAASRELLEETGLTDQGKLVDLMIKRVFDIDPRWQNRYQLFDKINTEYEFHYILEEKCEIKIDTREHHQYEWITINEAIDRVWSWTNKEALESLSVKEKM
tara:strand:- start:78 stop:521 length:444 start_codon:yes stop_codon:yes gene_type:complete